MANNLKKHWPQQAFHPTNLDSKEVMGYTLYLIQHEMIYYFTDQCPFLEDFKD